MELLKWYLVFQAGVIVGFFAAAIMSSASKADEELGYD